MLLSWLLLRIADKVAELAISRPEERQRRAEEGAPQPQPPVRRWWNRGGPR